MPRLTELPTWPELRDHARTWDDVHLRALFETEPERFEYFHQNFADALVLDYSRQPVSGMTLALLQRLAREADLSGAVERLFNGEAVNTTEGRAALHTALRHPGPGPVYAEGEDVMPAIRAAREQMRRTVAAVHSGDWLGATGRPVRHVVNIGIGGSDLGPAMVCEALKPWARPGIEARFLSNVDDGHVADVLGAVDPETTLFIVASKSFGTQETLTNARTARSWLLNALGDRDATEAEVIRRHFVAVSANVDAAVEFGIDADNVFAFWDWVGGRYSLWSPIGLPIALALGMEPFEALLAGAHAMDEHYRNEPLETNLPATLGLLALWQHNGLGVESHAILPYAQNLRLFPDYFQQGDMESNGKSTTLDGRSVDYTTGPVLWGNTGTNGQHAFFQLLHQGTRRVSLDFIATAEPTPVADPALATPLAEHHRILLSHFFAQTRALMRGKTEEEVRAELAAKGTDPERIDALAPHMVLAGNRPSTTLLLRRLDPWTLGALIALYEHKIYTLSVLWGTNAFDQWGVEFGKQTAARVLPALEAGGDTGDTDFDSATRGLLRRYRDWG
ncbi:MAG: glucose-6-phosphate isomerase [Pseudomonadota bacterium]